MKSIHLPRLTFFYVLIVILATSCAIKPKNGAVVDVTKTIPVLVSKMDVDNLGNVYVIDHKGKLLKYNENGILVFEFYNKRLGDISSIDVSNPLEILIFFQNYGVVKSLDNTLSEIKSVDFNKEGKFVGTQVFCKSNDSFLWIADPTTQKILKVDDQLKVKLETNRFSDLGINELLPIKMREAGNHLVVMTQNNGFLIFDNFGQFDKSIIALDVEDFQFDGKGLLYKTLTNYRYQKISFPDFYFVSLPPSVDRSKVLDARKINNIWYIAYAGGVDILK